MLERNNNTYMQDDLVVNLFYAKENINFLIFLFMLSRSLFSDSDSSRSRLGCVTPTRVGSRSKKEESETLP